MTNTRELLEAVEYYKLRIAISKKIGDKIDKLGNKRDKIDLELQALTDELYTGDKMKQAFDGLINAINDWNGGE